MRKYLLICRDKFSLYALERQSKEASGSIFESPENETLHLEGCWKW